MKYIKCFEKSGDYFWYIKGNKKKVLDILQHCIGIIPKADIQISNIEYYDNKPPLRGAFITSYSTWYSVNRSYKYDMGFNYYINNGNKYAGEIKLADGKIVIDTFDIDVEKYNL